MASRNRLSQIQFFTDRTSGAIKKIDSEINNIYDVIKSVIQAQIPDSAQAGDIRYDTVNKTFERYDGTNWVAITPKSVKLQGAITGTGNLTSNGQITIDTYVGSGLVDQLKASFIPREVVNISNAFSQSGTYKIATIPQDTYGFLWVETSNDKFLITYKEGKFNVDPVSVSAEITKLWYGQDSNGTVALYIDIELPSNASRDLILINYTPRWQTRAVIVNPPEQITDTSSLTEIDKFVNIADDYMFATFGIRAQDGNSYIEFYPDSSKTYGKPVSILLKTDPIYKNVFIKSGVGSKIYTDGSIAVVDVDGYDIDYLLAYLSTSIKWFAGETIVEGFDIANGQRIYIFKRTMKVPKGFRLILKGVDVEAGNCKLVLDVDGQTFSYNSGTHNHVQNTIIREYSNTNDIITITAYLEATGNDTVDWSWNVYADIVAVRKV